VAVDRVTLVDAEHDCVFESSLGLAVPVDTVRETDGVEEQVLVRVLVNLGVVVFDDDRVGVNVSVHAAEEVMVGDVETLGLTEELSVRVPVEGVALMAETLLVPEVKVLLYAVAIQVLLPVPVTEGLGVDVNDDVVLHVTLKVFECVPAMGLLWV